MMMNTKSAGTYPPGTNKSDAARLRRIDARNTAITVIKFIAGATAFLCLGVDWIALLGI